MSPLRRTRRLGELPVETGEEEIERRFMKSQKPLQVAALDDQQELLGNKH